MNTLIKKIIFPLAAIALVFSACDKPDTTEQLGDQGAKLIKFVGFGGTQGDNFKTNSNLAFDPTSSSEQLEMNLEYSTDKVASNDITVTLGVDQAALDAYNATVDSTNQYALLPTAAYDLPTTPIVIRAGQTISESFYVTFHPDQIDASQNFMLPLAIKTITGAPAGVVAASGTGIAYLHFIGNPLAGTYDATGYFYHPTAPRAISAVKPVSAVDANTLAVELGDLGASGYFAFLRVDGSNHVTITAADGAAGAPYTQFDDGLPTSNPGYTAAWPGSAQCNNTYDPVTKTFYLRYGYMGANGWRVTEEILVKQ